MGWALLYTIFISKGPLSYKRNTENIYSQSNNGVIIFFSTYAMSGKNWSKSNQHHMQQHCCGAIDHILQFTTWWRHGSLLLWMRAARAVGGGRACAEFAARTGRCGMGRGIDRDGLLHAGESRGDVRRSFF